uniref:Uncharacterized protein n=1 Tax=Rhizophora mucronata TaxID=61149 RepID=A0A2P2J0R4_RHIMU
MSTHNDLTNSRELARESTNQRFL